MATPNGSEVYRLKADQPPREITEVVQIMYDIVVDSLDWGSGFLDGEEMERVLELAELCGFEVSDYNRSFARRQAEEDRERRLTREAEEARAAREARGAPDQKR